MKIYYQKLYNKDDYEVLVRDDFRFNNQSRRVALCTHEDDAKEVCNALIAYYQVEPTDMNSVLFVDLNKQAADQLLALYRSEYDKERKLTKEHSRELWGVAYNIVTLIPKYSPRPDKAEANRVTALNIMHRFRKLLPETDGE